MHSGLSKLSRLTADIPVSGISSKLAFVLCPSPQEEILRPLMTPEAVSFMQINNLGENNPEHLPGLEGINCGCTATAAGDRHNGRGLFRNQCQGD